MAYRLPAKELPKGPLYWVDNPGGQSSKPMSMAEAEKALWVLQHGKGNSRAQIRKWF